ncbi:Serine/Threonine protein kinase [Cedratvirus A11]|uniref:Serine/Threonine protein kinase n=1 Tax=Cedratvirus A11 TaxID=1903266 RepID=A0A1M7XV87_9VIRU|nr:Serine/Threonine protein kinase [Cedratvirus A11]SHO33596.1 Serine/Threonine protein kinase [Cedratvirus A11]
MKVLGKIGQGAYGSVYKVEHKEKIFALKRNTLDNHISFHGSLRELDMLTKLKGHPYIVSFEGLSFSSPLEKPLSPLAGHDIRSDELFFILENADTDLHDLIYRHGMGFEQYKSIVLQLLLVLEYIHAKGIIHRDIKPSNILWKSLGDASSLARVGDTSSLARVGDASSLARVGDASSLARVGDTPSEGSVRLCDFGLSKFHTLQGQPTPRVITAWYRSPEVFVGSYSYKADIWSLGCVLAECLAKKPLFRGHEEEVWRALQKFKKPEEVLPGFIGLSPEQIEEFGKRDYQHLLQLLSGMLAPNPEKRYTATECLDSYFCRKREDLIIEIRTKNPPVADPEILFSIHSCFERDKAVGVVNDIFNHAQEIEWYSPRILFTSLMLFDRYLDYLHVTYPEGIKKVEASNSGKYHSERGVILRYLVCLYMSIKYHSTLYVPDTFTNFTGKTFSAFVDFSAETLKCAHDFEKLMIQKVCRYRIYTPTPYERAHIILSPDQVRLLLYYYGAIGECKTTSRRIFSSWLIWMKRK